MPTIPRTRYIEHPTFRMDACERGGLADVPEVDEEQEQLKDTFEQFLQYQRKQSSLRDLIRNSTEPRDAPEERHDAPGAAPSTTATENDDRNCPQDCYAILAFNGPRENDWPLHRILFCSFGLIPFFFQMTFLVLLTCQLNAEHTQTMVLGDQDLTTAHFIAGNQGLYLKAARVVSLLAYVMFPNSTLQDVIKAIQLFPWNPDKGAGIPIGFIQMACILRGIQANYATIVAFLLVMSSNNIHIILLSLMVVNSISELNAYVFSLAKSGVFGPMLKEEANRIAHTKLPACIYRESKHLWYWAVMVCYAVIFFEIAMMTQRNNQSWMPTALLVQFYIGIGLILTTIPWSIYCHWKRTKRTKRRTILAQEVTAGIILHSTSSRPKSEIHSGRTERTSISIDDYEIDMI